MELDKFRNVDLVIDHVNKTFIQKQFVSQNDNDGRTFTFQVTNGGAIGEVPGITANLRWTNLASGRTDLSAFQLIDKKNSVFQIKYPKNMLNPGKVVASIQIIQNGQVAHSKQFEITVQQLAGEAKGIIEKAEYSALVEVLADSNKFRTDIDSLDIDKADKTQVIKIENMISQLPSATPKETFASLDELRAKYPTGDSAAMVVLEPDGETGYVYQWNGSEWKKGILYMAQGIADKTIDHKKVIDTQLRTTINSYATLKDFAKKNPIGTLTKDNNYLSYDFYGSQFLYVVPYTDGDLKDEYHVKFDFRDNGIEALQVLLTDSDGNHVGDAIVSSSSSVQYKTVEQTITKKMIIDRGLDARFGLTIFVYSSVLKRIEVKDFYINAYGIYENLEDSIRKIYEISENAANDFRKFQAIGQKCNFENTAKYKRIQLSGQKYMSPMKTADKDYLLKKIKAFVLPPLSGNWEFKVGILDQRDLIVDERAFIVPLEAGYNDVDIEDKQIRVPQGYQVFMNNQWINVLYQSTDPDEKKEGMLIQDSSHVIEEAGYSGMYMYETEYLLPFSYELIEKDVRSEVKEVNEQVNELTEKVNSIDFSKDQLVAPDGTVLRQYIKNDFTIGLTPLIPGNILIFGNSLTRERGGIGMCASDQYHDYYHIVREYLENLNSELVISDRSSLVSFESATTTAERNLWWESIKTDFSESTDLVILQMIDNVNTAEKLATFEQDSIDLIFKIRQVSERARILWVAGWFVSESKMEMIRRVCEKTGTELVDITQFNSNQQFKGKIGMERTGIDGSTWIVDNTGEASHPGDLGMQKIAEKIIEKIGI